MERPTCRIYTAATDALYLPGAATLVHSIQRLAQLPCSITLLFHPSVADSQLSRASLSLLRCAAAPLKIRVQRVDDGRMQTYHEYARAGRASRRPRAALAVFVPPRALADARRRPWTARARR